MDSAVIDASSIIYCIQAGFFWTLGTACRLFSTPEVIGETKWKDLPVNQESPILKKTGNNDDTLLALAAEKKLPLVSEDRKLLLKAEEQHRPFYNSLMMLIWLEAKQKISEDDYREHLAHLKEYARYSLEIWNYGEKVRGIIL